jgi:hypothetical protein
MHKKPQDKFYVAPFRGKEGLESIRNQWKIVNDNMNGKRFFHLYEWYISYITALEKDDLSVYFFVVYWNDQPRAIFPLRRTIKDIYGLKLMIFELPQETQMPFCDFILPKNDDTRDILRAFIGFLNGSHQFAWDVIRLPKVLEDCSILYSLNCTPYPLTISEFVGYCNYLACEPYEQIMKNVSKNFRSNLRKARNKLCKLESVEYSYTRDAALLQQYYKEFLDLEASGWKGIHGTRSAIKFRSRLPEFYSSLVENFSSIGGVEIQMLRVDGVAIASDFLLWTDNTCYKLKTAYDESYKKYAPGHMLRENLFKRCYETQEAKYINFISNADWHQQWKPLKHKVFTCSLFNKSPYGLSLFILKRCMKIVPPLYRSRLRRFFRFIS